MAEKKEIIICVSELKFESDKETKSILAKVEKDGCVIVVKDDVAPVEFEDIHLEVK